MTPCYHEGHDCDCSHELECPVCREVTYDMAAHVCHDMAWVRWRRSMQHQINTMLAPRKSDFTLAGPRKGDT